MLGAFLSACIDIVVRDEMIRINSPDSRVDAVLIRVNTGATTSYSYAVYIVPAGHQVDRKEELFRADNVDDLEIHWKQPQLLSIRYKKARIFHFSNFWQSKEIENFRYIVNLQLTNESP